MWAANASQWFDYHDYLKYITVPSLFYAGAKEEASVPLLKDLVKQLPNCQLQVFHDIDHCEAYWGSKLVAPVIKDFIKGIIK